MTVLVFNALDLFWSIDQMVDLSNLPGSKTFMSILSWSEDLLLVMPIGLLVLYLGFAILKKVVQLVMHCIDILKRKKYNYDQLCNIETRL